MFPRKELKPAYDKAVWLHVYRDFSGSDADRAAERICLRFGFSSYPQHHLYHPATLEHIADTGRQLEGFLAAFDRAKIGKIGTTDALGRIEAAEKRAAKLETDRSVTDAIAALDEDDDIVVRYRAVEVLVEKQPASLASRAEKLLAVPNDPLRYLVCDALKALADEKGGKRPKSTGDEARADPEKLARVLEGVVKEPKDSLNPNVLRIHAVQALATCGDAKSIDVVAPHARGTWNNGLTGIAVDTLLAIGKRLKDAKKPATAALAEAYPEPSKDDERAARAVDALAKRVHAALEELTGKNVKFPATYDAAARKKLAAAW